jgi:hypothetical protein
MKGREDTSTCTPVTTPNGDVGFEVAPHLDLAHVFSALARGDVARHVHPRVGTYLGLTR